MEEMRMTDAERFFYTHAGYSYDPKTQTKEEGRVECAQALTQAEAFAERNGWSVEWRDEDEAWDGDDDYQPQEILCALLRDANGRVLGSLGMIADPNRNYGRVIEAELALEAMAEAEEAAAPQIATACLTHP